MPKISIVGNSGAARECYWILQDLLAATPGIASYYEFAGFYSWRGYEGSLKELASFFRGPLEEHEIAHDELYVIGVGKPQLRRDIFQELKGRGARFMNLIHPWSYICSTAKLGEGNIIQRGGTLYANAEMGDGNYLNGAVTMAHDAKIGDFNFIGPFALVLGGASMGSANSLAPRAMLLEKTKIGDNNILAPDCAVYKGCGSNCRMAGNPALKVGAADDGR